MNKKGQIAKTITTFAVMFWIFFILGIYLFLSGAAYAAKRPAVPASIEGVNLDNILLREIEIRGIQGKIMIFDALVEYWNDKVDINVLGESLDNLMMADKKNSYCLAIAQGNSKDPAGLTGGNAIDDFFKEYKDGKIISGHTGSKPESLAKYEKAGILSQISFINKKDEKRIYIQYYYGPCLEDKDEYNEN